MPPDIAGLIARADQITEAFHAARLARSELIRESKELREKSRRGRALRSGGLSAMTMVAVSRESA